MVHEFYVSGTGQAMRCGWRFAWLGWLVIGAGCSSTVTPVKTPTVATVTVVIKLGDEVVQRELEAIASGTTIDQVMAKIEQPKVVIIGSGATAFVESIGGLGTVGGKGWSYRVDDQWADRGIGVFELNPPTTIQWTYGEFSESQE